MKKRSLSTFGIFLMMAGMLTACGTGKGSVTAPQLPETQAASTGAEQPASSDAAAEQETSASEVHETSEAAQETSVDKEQTASAEDFVVINRTETKAGTLEIPHFNTKALNSKDFELAGQMFDEMEETLLASAQKFEEEAKQYGDDLSEWSDHVLSETRVALNDNILSVLVRYKVSDYCSAEWYSYEGVNIDTLTGNVIPYAEMLKKADYSDYNVETSLSWYGEKCLYTLWENLAYYRLKNEPIGLDGRGDPNPQWEEEQQAMLERFYTQPDPQGKAWDTLERYPTVFYEGADRLAVCAPIPSPAGVGFEWSLVEVGRNTAELTYRNPEDCYGIPFGNSMMSSEAAREIVSRMLKLDDDGVDPDGVKLQVEPDYIQNIETSDGKYDPYYVVHVYEDMETHTATYGRWAVGAFSGRILRQDVSTGDWQPAVQTEELVDKNELLTQENGRTPAIFWCNPDAYEAWMLQPCDWCDLTVYGQDAELPKENLEELMVLAMADNTTVSLDAGFEENGRFETQSVFYEMQLQKGQCVSIMVQRPEVPNQAVTVKNQFGTVTYTIKNDGKEP